MNNGKIKHTSIQILPTAFSDAILISIAQHCSITDPTPRTSTQRIVGYQRQ